jgi:predicted HD superfamily hydrolase involved in NAD metabolism
MGVGRYRHCAGVARMAERLAARHGASTFKARIAGIVHDVARLWKDVELLAYAAEHGIPVSTEAEAAPVLLHASVGADVARREFGIDDPETLRAIEHHTVAAPGMSDLDKVVYLADTFEPSRKYPARAALESAAFRSLDEGMLASVKASMDHLAARNIKVAKETMQLYDQMVRRYAGAS